MKRLRFPLLIAAGLIFVAMGFPVRGARGDVTGDEGRTIELLVTDKEGDPLRGDVRTVTFMARTENEEDFNIRMRIVRTEPAEQEIGTFFLRDPSTPCAIQSTAAGSGFGHVMPATSGEKYWVNAVFLDGEGAPVYEPEDGIAIE